MPVSNDDLLKSLNIIGKVLTDMQYQSKSIGNKTVVTLEHVDGMLKRAAKDTGISSESMNKLLTKFIKNTGGIGPQSKLIHALEEFNKKNPNYDRLGKLVSANEFRDFVDKAVEKIRVSPIKLNTKENLSLISKAISKGNKDYASTGFGKVSTEFYRKASKDQINELRLMRKSIQNGDMLSSSRSHNILKNIVGGIAPGADMLLQNAGFGELPAKFIDVFKAINEFRESKKKEKGSVEEERNALLLSSNRMAESSYAEQRRVTAQSKESLVNVEMQRDELQNALSGLFDDVLSKTSLDPKLKETLEKKLIKGTLTSRDIGKIISNWQDTLGDQITPDDKKDMKEFRRSILSDIQTMKEIGLDVDDATKAYASNLEREKQALINSTKSRSEIDRLMYAELEGQFKDLDKKLKGSAFKKNTAEEINLLRSQLQGEIAEQVRSKYGVSGSESKGIYADHSRRVSEILSEQGMDPKQIQETLTSDNELSNTLGYFKNFQSKLEGLSDIFKVETFERKTTTEPKSLKTPKSRKTIAQLPPNIPTLKFNDDLESLGNISVPSKQSGIRSISTHSDIANESIASPKQDAFESIKDSSKKADETHKLLEKVFGKNAEKSIRVEVVNWPSPQPQANTPASLSTSPPSLE